MRMSGGTATSHPKAKRVSGASGRGIGEADIKSGALMNLSEDERFDKMFPAHPISMCREFINCVTEKVTASK